VPFHNIADADIYYELSGSGRPAVVLIHGGMCDHRDWTGLVPLLAPGNTVLTFDLRAHGKSGGDPTTVTAAGWAEDINALVATLNLAPAVLVGHSMGSRIAAEAIGQRPRNAAALVLLDGSRAYAGQPAKIASSTGPPPSPTDVITSTIGPYANEEVHAHVLATMSAASEALMIGCLRAMTEWDTRRSGAVFSGLARTLPVLAIQSTYHDRSTPRYALESEDDTTPYLDFLRRTVPQVETKVLTRTGHFSMMERPRAVAALIRDFIRRGVVLAPSGQA
jgi:pimeloyl-ACP methyl ester carboxylesterase